LNSFGLSKIPFRILVLGNIIHVILCYILAVKCSLGIKGIGIAAFISNFMIFIGEFAYPYSIEELRPALKGPDWRMFKDLSGYLKLGVPSALVLCFEMWAFEFIILFAGYLGVKE